MTQNTSLTSQERRQSMEETIEREEWLEGLARSYIDPAPNATPLNSDYENIMVAVPKGTKFLFAPLLTQVMNVPPSPLDDDKGVIRGILESAGAMESNPTLTLQWSYIDLIVNGAKRALDSLGHDMVLRAREYGRDDLLRPLLEHNDADGNGLAADHSQIYQVDPETGDVFVDAHDAMTWWSEDQEGLSKRLHLLSQICGTDMFGMYRGAVRPTLEQEAGWASRFKSTDPEGSQS